MQLSQYKDLRNHVANMIDKEIGVCLPPNNKYMTYGGLQRLANLIRADAIIRLVTKSIK